MDISNIIQAILVGILVIVTGYYAIQTHRQANLLKKQINENREARERNEKIRSLDRINDWTKGIYLAITTGSPPDTKEMLCLELENTLFPFSTEIPEMIAASMSFSNEFIDTVESICDGLLLFLKKLREGDVEAKEFIEALADLLVDINSERLRL